MWFNFLIKHIINIVVFSKWLTVGCSLTPSIPGDAYIRTKKSAQRNNSDLFLTQIVDNNKNKTETGDYLGG